MPEGSHEIIDDFELDMDIETITLDDIDIREFEEPLPEEFGGEVGSMEVGSVGNIENIQINTATFGGGGGAMGEMPQGEGGGGATSGMGSMTGDVSLKPEELTISAPSITIQTENLSVMSPSGGLEGGIQSIQPQVAPGGSSVVEESKQVSPEEPMISGLAEAPAIESLNVDELEFGGISSENPVESSGEVEIPTIAKDETINLLEQEEPPIEETPIREENVAEPIFKEESPVVGKEQPKPPLSVNEEDEIVSVSGDELDQLLYGDMVGGIEVVSEEVGKETVLPVESESVPEEFLVSPEAIEPQGEVVFVETDKNQVPLEENFELIVEDKGFSPQETVYASEPTEVLRETNPLPEREKEVPLPDLEKLDTVMEEPLLQREEPTQAFDLAAEEIQLEPIVLEETPFAEMGEPVSVVEETLPETVEMVEAEPVVIERESAPLISDISEEAPASEQEEVPFQFDLSAIPDLQPNVEDENEPIALSLDELNNIEVTEEPALTMEVGTSEVTASEMDRGVSEVSAEPVHEIASVGEEEAVSDLERVDIPVETEVPLSLESFDSIVAEEEKIEDLKQQDLNQLIEVAEPDLESLESMEEQEESEKETELPPLAEAETVEVSLEDLGMTGEEEISEPLVGEAYMPAAGSEEFDRRQVIETNLDALSGSTREELRKVLQYLDNLLSDLPEDKIKEFAQSEYYDLYMKIMGKLGL
ncbi:hypothetical protein [Thermospira aquatica]|uniref:Uncharacterized protein n=1 Tax=Thermospira aquatica TaxID=2828656 RepID=A0AAX3BE63_9SPIR|nr:hypothetical protein [Thermospira aquatica]URA10500.1 hypothetical protein KDW03_01475 [Thermospira aquatica]